VKGKLKIKATKEEMEQGRNFLKGDLWEKWGRLERDQENDIPPPPIQEPYPTNSDLIDLIEPQNFSIGNMPLIDVINRRRSKRNYTKEPFNLEELSFLLWVTQGVQKIIGERLSTLRTVPSGGARHPFETYLIPLNVLNLKPALYRYLAVEHKLCLIRENLDEPFKFERTLVQSAPIVFIWTTIPYRTEWRYSLLAHKLIAQDSGHLCQNLYLASESIGAGTCAVGAFNQVLMDQFLGVDGKNEFSLYCARVGKVRMHKPPQKIREISNLNTR